MKMVISLSPQLPWLVWYNNIIIVVCVCVRGYPSYWQCHDLHGWTLSAIATFTSSTIDEFLTWIQESTVGRVLIASIH